LELSQFCIFAVVQELFFYGTGVWIQGFALARQVLYHLSYPSDLVLKLLKSKFPACLAHRKTWFLSLGLQHGHV
jgi:hypothetical protein